MKNSRVIFLIVLLLIEASLGLAKEEAESQKLSELRVFNRTMLLMKEQYVEPERLSPRSMLLAALNAVEQRVPEIVITELKDDDIMVQIGNKSKKFSIGGLTSLWDLSFRLRDIFRFIEADLPKTIDVQEIQYAAVNGSLSKSDPHSVLLEPKFSAEVKNTTRGEFGGLGVQIGLRDGFLTVISPLEGSPAARAGIKALDRIIKINEDSTINLALDEAVEQLRGKPGTAVYLTVERKNEQTPRKIKVIRDIIKVDSVSSQLLANKYGYVKVKSFHGNTAKDVRESVLQMQSKSRNQLKGLILDFRNNPGGLLDQSIAIADLFLDGGIIVVTQGAGAYNREEENATEGSEKNELPIVVLVNGGSASASEIVAGAIKNRNRGIVMGEQTFGKGSVQMLYDFPDKSSLKLTIAQYLTPGDESIQSVGITPDILLRPIYADDKKKILLFPENGTREEDLEAHLNDERRIIKRKPIYELSYLDKSLNEVEIEKRSISSKYYEDYEIALSQKILEKAENSSREALLKAASLIIEGRKAEESKKLIVALKKLGIDWSFSKNISVDSQITARVISPLHVKAGETLHVKVEVKNISKAPVYQVYGISKSDTSLFDGCEFIFGKLMPGEKKLWSLEIKIPKEALSRRDMFQILFKGNDNKELSSLEVPVSIQGLPKPVLAYTYYLDDANLGNGNGSLDENEKIDLVILVKNVGTGVAEEPWALLKNLSGSEVFIDKGRYKMPILKPGETAEARLSLVLRQKNENPKVQIQIYDAVMGDYWGEKISLDNMRKFRKIDKQDTSGIVYHRVPPRIDFALGKKKPIVARGTYNLPVIVNGKNPIKDVFMFVNDQKVLYRSLDENQKEIKFEKLITLKPGVNLITLVARENEDYGQKESVIIFSETKELVAKDNPSHT